MLSCLFLFCNSVEVILYRGYLVSRLSCIEVIFYPPKKKFTPPPLGRAPPPSWPPTPPPRKFFGDNKIPSWATPLF